MEVDTESNTQPMEVDNYDGPRVSSFKQMFLDLKTLAGGDNLEAILDLFTADSDKNKREETLVSICRKYEQDVFVTMMKPDTLKASNYFKDVKMAALAYMKDCNYGEAYPTHFYETNWQKGQFLWEELLQTALLVLGEWKADPATFDCTMDLLNHYEYVYQRLITTMLRVFPQTAFAAQLRNQLRMYIRQVLCNKLNRSNVYVNVDLPQ